MCLIRIVVLFFLVFHPQPTSCVFVSPFLSLAAAVWSVDYSCCVQEAGGSSGFSQGQSKNPAALVLYCWMLRQMKKVGAKKQKQVGSHVSTGVLCVMVQHHYVHTAVRRVLISACCLCTIHGDDQHLVACAVVDFLASSTSSSFFPESQSRACHTTLSFIYSYTRGYEMQRVYLLAKLAMLAQQPSKHVSC